jgi:hypothetical protein
MTWTHNPVIGAALQCECVCRFYLIVTNSQIPNAVPTPGSLWDPLHLFPYKCYITVYVRAIYNEYPLIVARY